VHEHISCNILEQSCPCECFSQNLVSCGISFEALEADGGASSGIGVEVESGHEMAFWTFQVMKVRTEEVQVTRAITEIEAVNL
jgi:hypothetical protein